jgi:methionine-S-sulfoxide reductase
MNTTLVVAGGCFWCVEHDMRKAPGVVAVVSGYSGGDGGTPSYENHEGYREAVRVEYDTTLTTYKKLLQYFIDHIDPTDAEGQFADKGESYQTAIFFETAEEQTVAEQVIEELNASGVYELPSAVALLPRKPFYTAEEYHQDYASKNELRYELYRLHSGREGFVQNTCTIREEKHIQWSE